MSRTFLEAVENRRTFYAISKESPISKDDIQRIVEQAVKFDPTAFNSQSARVVLLFGKEHDELWNITEDALRKVVPADAFAQTQERIASFRNGFGTVLFFEDQDVVEGLQKQFSLYKDNFPLWSLQSSGMLQFIVWTALEEQGLGVSLQHYNPLIDNQVKSRWNVPGNWKLWGQMPFGKPAGAPDEKQFLPLDDRIKVFG